MRKRGIILAAIVCLSFCGFCPSALAEELPKNSIAVSPPSQTMSLHPGETYTGTIKVLNPSSSGEEIEYEAVINPYSVAENYDADFNNTTSYNAILDWITITNPTGTIASNESVDLEYVINVPEDAAGGGQYCAIAIRNKTSSNTSTVNNVLEIASIIYARVDGDITLEGEVKNNSVPLISFKTPITTGVTLTNTGNSHLVASVKIRAANFFTGKTVYPQEDSADTSFTEVVLPETTRYANFTISNLASLGLYHVTQEVEYNGVTDKTTRLVLVCPLWFMILLILTITAIILFIVRRVRRRKIERKIM